MPEDLVERAMEEHGHVLRKETESTEVVHLPDPDNPHEETDCYATDGVRKLVLESFAQVPMGATLCKLCQGAETGSAGAATNTAEAVRKMARDNPGKIRELLGEPDHGVGSESDRPRGPGATSPLERPHRRAADRERRGDES